MIFRKLAFSQLPVLRKKVTIYERKDIIKYMINIKGQKFNRLTPIDYMGKSLWRCSCDCGKTCYVLSYNIIHNRTKSCGCLLRETVYAKNIVGKPLGESACNHIYWSYMKNAQARGYEFELSPEFVREITQKPCFYCGASPSNIKRNRFGRGDVMYNGIDRKNNAIGYIEENVVPCCFRCNEAKKNFDADDFLEWIKDVYAHSFGS